ncbi:MAG: hypothetical protein EBZ51_10980 [Synechococcaceae bacterium WB9_2_112]|nr:hypothetical protein [Synechococcaceae bacterium WB9_2_112]
MAEADALEQLLAYRQRRWLSHCSDVLHELLLPIARQWRDQPQAQALRGAVLIENRIDQQWLFTVLNTALMCPTGTQLCLISDAEALPRAQALLKEVHLPVEPWWAVAENLVPGSQLSSAGSFNRMMKQGQFWGLLPHEQLLICQTDSLFAAAAERNLRAAQPGGGTLRIFQGGSGHSRETQPGCVSALAW